MRTIVLPSAAWLGVLQAFVAPSATGFETVARLIALASVLGSLTVMIYRLGVWRQEMENTKSNVNVGIERIERRLEAIERRLDGLEATLAIAIVLAMPLLGALERVRPGEVVGLAKALVARFGEGGVRTMGSVFDVREPSKFDDHRNDAH